ncbi:hypothetical protein TacPo2_69 [Pantoea bacteriophage TacPo2]
MAKVELTGVDSGTTTLTVKSASDPTKLDTIDVEVVDTSISTSSVTGLVVGATAEITATIDPELTGATVAWTVSEVDPGDDGYITVVPVAGNDRKATLTGVKEGGGRIQAEVSYNGLKWSDSSRVVVGPKDDPAPQTK